MHRRVPGLRKDGVVTLTGSVSEESHKTLARETVAGVSGVKKVDNRLDVKGQSLAAVNSDAWLITKVKTSLLFHRSVSATSTEVDAQDGVVTLQGDAASQAQKDLTTEYAKDVDGVKEVKNVMVVATPSEQAQTAGDKIDDASITGLSKMTLLYHRSTMHHSLNFVRRPYRGYPNSIIELWVPARFPDQSTGRSPLMEPIWSFYSRRSG